MKGTNVPMEDENNPAFIHVRDVAIILARDVIRHLGMKHVNCGGGDVGALFSKGAYCMKCLKIIEAKDNVMICGIKTTPTFSAAVEQGGQTQ